MRANDPRARRARRPPRVVTFDEMHELAASAGYYEPMLRTLGDCGLRLGELLALARADFDGDQLQVRGSAHNGVTTPGDQPTKKHVRDVPVPPSTARLLATSPPRIHSQLLFPTPTGKRWWERNFYRDVWYPARTQRDWRSPAQASPTIPTKIRE